MDVSNHEEVKDWVEKTVNTVGKLDGAARFAGIGGSTVDHVEAQFDEYWKQVIDINLSGTMYSIQEELDHLNNGVCLI